MIFNSWKRIDDLSLTVKTLWAVIALLVVLNIMMYCGWKFAPQKMRIYIPPDLSHGAMLTPNHIPRSTVYAFAFQIFTAINSWPDSGTADYKRNISIYRNYLSPSFFQQLMQDDLDRANNGELARKRIMSGVSGHGYLPSDVKVLGNGTWLVTMALQIQETLDGSVIKNVIMKYPLLITRVHTSIQVNPWGLELAGFHQPPYRIKTIV